VSAAPLAASRDPSDSRLDDDHGGSQARGSGRSARSRKIATPITPTLSGRSVRAAYESASDVKQNAAASVMLLRQPVISALAYGAST